MKEMRYFYAPDIKSSQLLPDEEAAHALRVLRLQAGETIYLTDGCGSLYEAVIEPTAGKKCTFTVKNEIKQEPLWKGHLHLAVAPTKNMDRMEWLSEKATEIGFDELSFLDCQWSERKVIKTERIDKIVVAAMKQSHKTTKPIVNELRRFRDFIETPFPGRKYIAHCHEEPALNPNGRPFLLDDLRGYEGDILLLVGPEGDFSTQEVAEAIQQGYAPISLGNSRLRTETAALAGVHLMNINNRR